MEVAILVGTNDEKRWKTEVSDTSFMMMAMVLIMIPVSYHFEKKL